MSKYNINDVLVFNYGAGGVGGDMGPTDSGVVAQMITAITNISGTDYYSFNNGGRIACSIIDDTRKMIRLATADERDFFLKNNKRFYLA